MGNLTWACLGVCATTVCELAVAQTAAPAPVAPSASAAFPSAPLPPPVPVPVPVPAPAPPAPYQYPYPYPPPPYGYPPPLPYGYYYPQPLPLVPPKPRFPDDAAVTTSPFLDAIVAGASWQNRVTQALNIGAEAGMYLGGRFRVAVRGAVPSSSDSEQPGVDSSSFDSSGYQRSPSDAPAFFYGASAGVVVHSTQDFALAPGIAFARTDVSDFGTMVAASVPLDWVMASGLRIGLELELGQAFGGSYRYQCLQGNAGASCGGPLQITRDRPSGTAFLMQFQIGFGFNHPDPLPPSPPPQR